MTMTMTSRAPLRPRRHLHWPTWLVSAKHRAVVSHEGGSEWYPVGEHHARVAGENLTACGLVAIGWPVFWLMPFQAAASTSCPECVAAVTRAAADSHQERPGCCAPLDPASDPTNRRGRT